jgi:hypothetical protein
MVKTCGIEVDLAWIEVERKMLNNVKMDVDVVVDEVTLGC